MTMVIIYLLLLLFILHGIQFIKAYFFPQPLPKRSFFQLVKEPAIFGHRGSPLAYPENTLLSFEEGLRHGEGLELDVSMTKDGIIIVLHDLMLERTTDGRGAVGDITYKDLIALNAGYHFQKDSSYPYRESRIHIPTLESVCKAFPQTPLIIEVKGSGEELAMNLARTISANTAQDQVLIAGIDDKTIQWIRDYLPDIQTGTSLREGIIFYILSHLGLALYFSWNFQTLCIPPKYKSLPLLTVPLRLAAKGLGLPIYLWTINTEEEIRKYLEIGVQGIISDYPERVKKVVEEMRSDRGQ